MNLLSLCCRGLLLMGSACFLSCSVDPIDFSGKSCSPGDCPAGYVCQLSTNSCEREGIAVVLCDSHSPANDCAGGSSAGMMTCFAAAQLGGHDFCRETCDANLASTDANFTCVSPGAKLQVCRPIEARKAAAPVCPTGLSCIAIDLVTDSGLCMPPCGPGDDCKPPLIPCDSSAADDTCNVPGAAAPMTCFRASALSGNDFCTEACDPTQAPSDPQHFTCTDSGSLLQICQPSAQPGDPWACPLGLSCYRRDPLGDSGLCIAMPLCQEDRDCLGTKRCTGAILHDLVGNSSSTTSAKTDHLNCVVAACQSLNTMCPSDQGCLAKPYFTGGLADFCVPQCDSQLHCPPNYSCAVEASGSSSPNLCFPGVPGVRCVDDLGCAGAPCQDTGAGFRVCSIPCAADANCEFLNTKNDSFVCVNGGIGFPHCVTPTVFSAPNCNPDVTTDCSGDKQCFQYAPFGSFAGHEGECRFPCDAAGQCASFGGLVHACLAGGMGGCYPAMFGIPCQSKCIADLQCADVPAEDSSLTSGPRICTLPCSADADCDNHPSTNHVGYCEAGFCRHGRDTGAPCTRSAQCVSRLCNSSDACG